MSTKNWVWGLSSSRPEQFCNKAPSLLSTLPLFRASLLHLGISNFSAWPHSVAAAPLLPLSDFPAFAPSLELSPTHRCLSLLLPGDFLGRRAPAPHPQPPRPMWNGVVEREGAGVMENPCSSQGQCLQTKSGLWPGPPQASAPLGHPHPQSPQAAFLQGPHMSRAEASSGGFRRGPCAVWDIRWFYMPILQRSKLRPRGKQRTGSTPQVSDRARTRISWITLSAFPSAAERSSLAHSTETRSSKGKINSAL